LPFTDYGIQHIVTQPCVPVSLFALLASPQAAGDFIFDIQYSTDSGVTWNTILASAITIGAGDGSVISSSSFATGVSLAPGNLLKLVVYSSGLGPAFSSGFSCSVQLQGTNIAGEDRASFNFGFTQYVPVATDFGCYWINTSTTQATSVSIIMKAPPQESNVHFDLQYQSGSSWLSLFEGGTPLTLTPADVGVVSSNSFDPTITLAPGTLIRPYLVSGPSSSGMGYNVSLTLAIIP
jgi:hypothetical protein